MPGSSEARAVPWPTLTVTGALLSVPSPVGPGAGPGRAAGAPPGLAAALGPAAASPTAAQGVGATASHDQLADLHCQTRARNVVLPADPNPRHP